MHLHGFSLSGHAYRVRLFLGLLGLPFTSTEVDLFDEQKQRRPEFLAKNPFGQVPVLEDGDVTLFDSNAILTYLALKYDRRWLPEDPAQHARVQSWLGVAAGPLFLGPALARMHVLWKVPADHERAKKTAERLFDVLEAELAQRPFVVGETPTIADLALYSYTAVAPEGGIALDDRPAIRAWLGRIEALPGYVPMRAP